MRILCTLITALVLHVLSSPVPGAAQNVEVHRQGNGYRIIRADDPGVVQILRSVRMHLSDIDAASERRQIPLSIQAFIVYRNAFPSATIDSLADGLERTANTHRDETVRSAAIGYLSLLAGNRRGQRPHPGTVERLVRLYNNGDLASRHSVVYGMLNLADRRFAISFLSDVAKIPPEPGRHGVLQKSAVMLLGGMGPEAAAALRDLDEKNLVRDLDAQFSLRALAQSGYQAPRIERPSPQER